MTVEAYIESVAILLSVGDHVSSVFLTLPVFGLAWSALSLGEEKLTVWGCIYITFQSLGSV